jgi:hypothetical protein
MSVATAMADDDTGRLSLAFQDLEAVPDQVAEAKGPSTTELDLTENALQCVDVARCCVRSCGSYLLVAQRSSELGEVYKT